MAGWDANALHDAIYDTLVANVTLAATAGGIWRMKTPRNQAATYPVLIYRPWTEPEHDYSIGDDGSTISIKRTKMLYRVTVWTENDPRGAATTAKLIQEVLTRSGLDANYSGNVLVCRCKSTVDREQEYDDTLTYYEAGGYYKIEVAP